MHSTLLRLSDRAGGHQLGVVHGSSSEVYCIRRPRAPERVGGTVHVIIPSAKLCVGLHATTHAIMPWKPRPLRSEVRPALFGGRLVAEHGVAARRRRGSDDHRVRGRHGVRERAHLRVRVSPLASLRVAPHGQEGSRRRHVAEAMLLRDVRPPGTAAAASRPAGAVGGLRLHPRDGRAPGLDRPPHRYLHGRHA